MILGIGTTPDRLVRRVYLVELSQHDENGGRIIYPDSHHIQILRDNYLREIELGENEATLLNWILENKR